MDSNRLMTTPIAICNAGRGPDDSDYRFIFKKSLNFFSYNLFPPVLLFTLNVFKKTRIAKFQTQICLLATPPNWASTFEEATTRRVPMSDDNIISSEQIKDGFNHFWQLSGNPTNWL
jgi:hypothetical protein